ncbi:MAG: YfcC family protein [Planctomycetota bacterium]|jgi:uncharacterized ion transporter superfamily protein YfcC
MPKSRFPHSLVLIFGMILVAQVTTYLVPAGTFDRDGRTVLPGTYKVLQGEDVPVQPWHTFLTSIPKGLAEAQDVIFFIFLIGGVIAVLRATGAIDAFLGAAIRRLGGRPLLLVAGMTSVFALGSGTIGMAEEYLPFVPILVAMGLAMRMDAMVALGIVYVGYGVGYGCAPLNPFTVVIAQDIAGLPVYSGQGLRWSLMAICTVVGVHHVMSYARRVQQDPAKSLVGDVDYSKGFEAAHDLPLTMPRLLILAAFAGGIALFVWGVNAHEWYLTEMAAIFMGVGILAAFLGRLGPNEVAAKFCEGASELATTALLVGFARTIEVVLSDAQVIDTIVHGIAGVLEGAGSYVAAGGMLAVQTVCNLFIPSGSGQAYVTMPIMAPLADLTGVTRQTAVLAFQMGDGFTNTIVPTNAVLMGMLAMGRIPYGRWLQFMVPLLLKIYAVALAGLFFAVAVGYQ